MVEEDLGEATIVYEGPDGTVERTVENEHVAYVQDHWIVKTGENEAGHDTVRRIPSERVYYVERDVEQFEREAATVFGELQSVADEFGRGVDSLRAEVESITEEVGTLLPGPGQREPEPGEPDVVRIDIEEDDEQEGADEGETGSDADRGDDEGA